jgi:hypothetical protein
MRFRQLPRRFDINGHTNPQTIPAAPGLDKRNRAIITMMYGLMMIFQRI